jgi:[ribosomal protein S5]-alanine N-acetyltransferase
MNEEAYKTWAPLYTERLLLREPVTEDASAIFRLRTDEKVNAMIGRKAPADVSGAMDFINQTNQRTREQQGFYWAICLNGELIGTICIFSLDKEMNRAEVGFEILPEYRGKGYMQESLGTILNFAFQKLQLDKMIAVVNPVNENSLNLLRKNNFVPAGDHSIDKHPNDLAFILANPQQAEQ